MHKKNDTTLTTSKTGAVTKAEQLSTTIKETLIRRPINMNVVSNTRLIWFDPSIDKNCTDYCDNMQKLHNIVSIIDSFADADECIDFLTDITNEKVHMIISGATDITLIPLIYDIQQLHTIFIYNKQQIEQQPFEISWFKVKEVFTEITSICEALKQAVQECENNTISISIMNISDSSKKNLDQLDPSFMYLQIMKEILLDIKFEQKHFNEYIGCCRTAFAENDRQLQKIKNFEQKYQEKTPIWWYTLECFLYPMVNRGLRTMDVDIIIKMGFFIKDLHRHIEQLHNEQFNRLHSQTKFIVYRGQGMAKTEFEHLTKSKGELISFNNFLSTSKDHDLAFFLAESNSKSPDLIGLLFIMTIDPSQSTTPFASIKNVSAIPGEDEVLFAMQTVFRIGDITPMGENSRLFQVELSLVSDNDKDLRQLTEYIRKETYPDDEGWYRLGSVLFDMGQFDKSEEVYKILMDQATTDSERANIHGNLGKAKNAQGEYKEAIALYEKAAKIYKRNLPSQKNNLATAYNSIGLVYSKMGEYSKALSYYEKSLAIQQQLLPPNHPDLAMSYNNIGAVYSKMGEYSKALSYYEKSLEIYQQSLPPNHPDLAMSYNNIGLVYDDMGEYSKALSYYEKSLEIQQQSLPPNHPDLAMSYNNIGAVYSKMGEYSKALSYYEKSLAIQQQLLPPNHPDLAMSYNNIGAVYSKMGEYSKTLSYYEKSLEIQQQSLPPNHPDLAMSYNNIGLVYDDMGEYSKALSYYERSLEIQQQSLPPNHPDLAMSYNNIGAVYSKMGEYSKTLSYYEKSLEIQQQSLPPNHPDLAMSYNNIGAVYSKMGEYSKALSYYERSLEIRQQSLSPNHPNLASSYGNIGLLYENMGNYSKAHASFERALQIVQQSLPTTHPVFRQHQNNFERIKRKF